MLRRGSRISWNFCTVVSVWLRHLSHKILIPYPFPWLFRVFQCFLPFSAAVEVCSQLFSCPISDLMFLFNAQLTVFIFLQGSTVSHGTILDVTLMGCFIWLCCVDFLHEDLSLLFQACLELFNFYVLLSSFSFGYSNCIHVGPLFSFFFFHIFLLFSLLCFTFLHNFFFIGYFTPQNSIGIFYCSICSSIAVLFPEV